MPRFMRGIHVFLAAFKGVDGPNKPGHDVFWVEPLGCTPAPAGLCPLQ